MAQVQLIAEIGSVHDGSFGNAQKLIELAADCGAHAVKFQTHLAETETTKSAPSPPYFSEESRIDYFRRLTFTEEQWIHLRELAHRRDLSFVSSPFSEEAVALLERVEIDAYKIASGEVTNLPMLEAVAVTGRPTYLSSGMSSWDELDKAVACLKDRVDLTVLQCSSIYPCPPERVGLNVIGQIRERYSVPVGLSDHTLTATAAIAAAMLGATVIEKHLTFSKRMYGSDAANAMEPSEFGALASSLQEVDSMLAAPVDKDDLQPYRGMKRIFEKSIVAASDILPGTMLDMEHLAFKKPGDGMPAARYPALIGRRTVRPLKADQQIGEEDVQ